MIQCPDSWSVHRLTAHRFDTRILQLTVFMAMEGLYQRTQVAMRLDFIVAAIKSNRPNTVGFKVPNRDRVCWMFGIGEPCNPPTAKFNETKSRVSRHLTGDLRARWTRLQWAALDSSMTASLSHASTWLLIAVWHRSTYCTTVHAILSHSYVLHTVHTTHTIHYIFPVSVFSVIVRWWHFIFNICSRTHYLCCSLSSHIHLVIIFL